MFSTFKKRLIGILLLINVSVFALGACAYYFLGDVGSRLDSFTQGIFTRLEIAHRLSEAADRRAIAVRNLALLTDPAQQKAAVAEFDKYQTATTTALAELKDAAAKAKLPPEVSGQINKIAEVEARYGPVAQAIVNQIQAGQVQEAVAKIQNICNPTLAELTTALHAYAVLTDTRTKAYVVETREATSFERSFMAVLAVLTLGGTFILGFSLWHSVHKTLGAEPEQLTAYLGYLADGNLSAQVTQSDVPAGSLLASMTRMRKQVRDVVEKVRFASDSIATGASEIANGNSDLSSRTEHQAGNLQRTASSMDEMSRIVSQNADTARAATGLATVVSASAAGGSDVMQRVTDTMAEISRSSTRIGDIIGVIDGIAFQTNILALNAAVEAARAGEQGRGFAVVASEVRTLAQRSAEAAKEIKSLISGSTERVEAGSSLVTEAGQKVGNIVHEVQRVVDLIHEIGQSAQEQSMGIADVTTSVNELDQGTQQNAALAEQSAAAAESLRLQSEELAAAVNYFKP